MEVYFTMSSGGTRTPISRLLNSNSTLHRGQCRRTPLNSCQAHRGHSNQYSRLVNAIYLGVGLLEEGRGGISTFSRCAIGAKASHLICAIRASEIPCRRNLLSIDSSTAFMPLRLIVNYSAGMEVITSLPSLGTIHSRAGYTIPGNWFWSTAIM